MVDANSGAPAAAALQQQIAQGLALLGQGRLEDASRLNRQLLEQFPGNPQVLYLASEIRLASGKTESALEAINAAIAGAPGQVALLLKKAQILVLMRRRDEVREAAGEAATLATAAGDARALWSVGKIYSMTSDPARARPMLEQALAKGIRHPFLHYDLATVQFFLGDFDAAEANIESLLALSPKTGQALYLRATLRRQTEDRNHVADLESRLAQGFPDLASTAACQFALAKELEDLGQYERSIQMLNQAAATKRQTLRHDAALERAAIDGIRDTYTAEVMAEATPGHDGGAAIFIVGMPRTGTTLVERMLGRHPGVGSAGELLDFGQLLMAASEQVRAANPGLDMHAASLRVDFAALGRDYLASAGQAAPGHRLLVDKMPINFMYCGMIHKALPKARIIHLVRDPMDTCYAVYKTLFNQAYPFSYEQGELAAYYATYHRLMQHWHEVMPGQILDVRYEDLVSDPEGQARRILEWCGLEWQPEVAAPAGNQAPSTTASAAQVREPIHAGSVQKWRKVASGLQPLQAALQSEGVIPPEA